MSAPTSPVRRPLVEIVVPARNEESDLVPSVTRLAAYLRENVRPTAMITIADNGSTDATPALARELAAAYPDLVRVAHLDPNFITVDKTPASLWVDEIVGRVFGFSSWTLLLPQAIEGVAAAWFLYAAVRRWFGPGAGLVAGVVFALTPAAALIFRFNNPDALLVLLMTASACCVQRAVERDSRSLRWLVLAGLLLGFGFLAKMLQAFLVIPGFGLSYLIAGPVRFRRRIWQTVVFGVSVIVGFGWWVAIAQLWPAGSRPYFGGQVSWLLPAALISLAALAWVARPRRGGGLTSASASAPASAAGRMRAFAALWGGWLTAAIAVGVTAWWSWELLDRTTAGGHRPRRLRWPW